MRVDEVTRDDLVVDNTILSDVAACSTKTAMRHVLGLTKAEEKVELRVGSDVHAALATWLSSKGDVKKAMARFRDDHKAWNENVVPAGERLSYPNVRRLLQHWFDENDLATWVVAVEPEDVEMALVGELGEIRGQRVVMVALLDAMGKRRIGGGKWSVDHKTARSLSMWWRDRQQIAAQFTGQLWLARENGIDLHGVFVNGIELPELNSSPRTCRTHGVTYQECATFHAKVEILPVTRSRNEIDAWADTAWGLVSRLVDLRNGVKTVADAAQTPMEGRFNNSCGFCPFAEWCRIGRPSHGTKGLFVEDRWSPLDHVQKRGGIKDGD